MFEDHGPCDVRPALFGGRGEVRVWDLLGGRAAPPFAAVLGCELTGRGSVGRHRQEHHAEIVVGVDGDGRAKVNGVEHRLGVGDVVHLPLGAVLEIENAGDQPLRYLIVKAG